MTVDLALYSTLVGSAVVIKAIYTTHMQENMLSHTHAHTLLDGSNTGITITDNGHLAKATA